MGSSSANTPLANWIAAGRPTYPYSKVASSAGAAPLPITPEAPKSPEAPKAPESVAVATSQAKPASASSASSASSAKPAADDKPYDVASAFPGRKKADFSANTGEAAPSVAAATPEKPFDPASMFPGRKKANFSANTGEAAPSATAAVASSSNGGVTLAPELNRESVMLKQTQAIQAQATQDTNTHTSAAVATAAAPSDTGGSVSQDNSTNVAQANAKTNEPVTDQYFAKQAPVSELLEMLAIYGLQTGTFTRG
jgi:hypothetical protein